MRIHVTNLNGSVAGKLLEEACKAIGDCQVRLYNTHAYVEYADQEHGEQALSTFNGREFAGKPVKTEVKAALTPIKSTPTPFVPAPPVRARSRSRSPVKDAPAVVHLPTFKPVQSVGIITLPTSSASPASLPHNLPIVMPHAQALAPKVPKVASPDAPAATSPSKVSKPAPTPVTPASTKPIPAKVPSATPQVAKPIPEESKSAAESDIITIDGDQFRVTEVNKNDDLTSVMCIVCNKNIQKRTVKNHIGTRSHKQAKK